MKMENGCQTSALKMKNKKLRQSFKTKPCLVCSQTPSDFCHIKTYATTLADSDKNAFPLCRRHHTEQGQIGIVTFIKKYPVVHKYVTRLGFYINEYGKLAIDIFRLD